MVLTKFAYLEFTFVLGISLTSSKQTDLIFIIFHFTHNNEVLCRKTI